MGCAAAFQAVLYAVSCAVFSLTFVFLMQDRENPIALAHGSHFQFLTIWGLFVTYLGQIFGLSAVLTGSKSIHNAKDHINLLAAPLAVLIAILYWSIKAVDTGLLIDPEIQVAPPMWLDLCLHAVPSAVELVDVLWYGAPWTLSVPQMVPVFAAFAGGYWVWIHYLFDKNGFFPYPLLSLVTTLQRAQIFAVSVLIVCGSYKIVKSLQAAAQGRVVAPKEKSN